MHIMTIYKTPVAAKTSRKIILAGQGPRLFREILKKYGLESCESVKYGEFEFRIESGEKFRISNRIRIGITIYIFHDSIIRVRSNRISNMSKNFEFESNFEYSQETNTKYISRQILKRIYIRKPCT